MVERQIRIPLDAFATRSIRQLAAKLPPANREQFNMILEYSRKSARRYAYLILHPRYLEFTDSHGFKVATGRLNHRKFKANGEVQNGKA